MYFQHTRQTFQVFTRQIHKTQKTLIVIWNFFYKIRRLNARFIRVSALKFLSKEISEFKKLDNSKSGWLSSSNTWRIRRRHDRSDCQDGPITWPDSRKAGNRQSCKITWPHTLLQGPLLTGRADELIRIRYTMRVMLTTTHPAGGVL